jgi:hypothetical protein
MEKTEKEYLFSVWTKELDRTLLLEDVDHLIMLCRQHGIDKFTVLFGWAWGYDFYNWIPQQMDCARLPTEITQAEQVQWGPFGQNDVLVTIPEYQLEVEYSHHSSIHLHYDSENDFVSAIRSRWKEKEWEANKAL